MSRGRDLASPPDRRAPLLAAALRGEERPRGEEDVRLSSVLRRELRRLGSHPVREIGRLEHQALDGESPATPAILIVGMALALWSLVALVVGVALLLADLLA